MGGGVIFSFLITFLLGKILFVPTDLLQGINAILFFSIGIISNRYNLLRYNSLITVISGFSLIATFYIDSMSIVRCYYPCLPLNLLFALIGTYFIFSISSVLKSNLIGKILSKLGCLSILILCIHNVDLNYGIEDILSNKIGLHNGGKLLFEIVCHIVLPIALSLLIYRNKFIKLIYFNKR